MNERIRQLAEQADIGFYWDSPSIYAPVGEPPVEQALITPEELAKFAELIVQECAQAFAAEVDSWKEMDPYQGSIKRQGTKAIKQHFGVEE